MSPNCNVRHTSTATPQSLLLLNSDFVLESSLQFAVRVRTDVGDDRPAQVRHAWRLAFTREPNESELASAVTFLEDQTAIFAERAPQPAEKKAGAPTPEQMALATLCQMLVSSNEFLYVD
jgi:hypothetical protein